MFKYESGDGTEGVLREGLAEGGARDGGEDDEFSRGGGWDWAARVEI
jgi:hypothetical protein